MTDYEHIIISAVRYALGRRTYIVETTVNYVIRNLDNLSSHCTGVILRDLKEATCLGDDCDQAEWMKLRRTIEERKDDIQTEMELGNLLFGNSRGEYPVARARYQDDFVGIIEALGLDGYGFCGENDPRKNEFDGITTDTFIVRPYYWGDDEEIAKLPNFEYLPKGFKLCWYKYPLRDSYSNIPLTKELLNEMLDAAK